MQFDWVTSLDRSLEECQEERLFELFHENSKLFPRLAQQQATSFSVSPFDLYLMSRGFRHYRNAEKIVLPAIEPSQVPLQEILLRRRSSRNLQGPVSLADLATLLNQSLGPTALVENPEYKISQVFRAWPSAGGLYPLDLYIVVSKVDKVPKGLYHYNPIMEELELLSSRPVDLILRDGFFWQEFITTAAVVLLFVAVFERTTAKYGERGYRLVLLDAGHAAQNVLLTAEQLGLGAVAIAGFCDDALSTDIHIDGVSEAVVHAVAIGNTDE